MRRLSLVIVCLSVSMVSCYRRPTPQNKPTDVVVIQKQPEGTEEYCWVEPRVVEEKNGPGVDPRGEWYSAPHTAVREVKQGRWKPCAEVSKK